MRWLGWALAASGVEVEAASAWRLAGLATRRPAGLALRRAGAVFLALGRVTGESRLIPADEGTALQCESSEQAVSERVYYFVGTSLFYGC